MSFDGFSQTAIDSSSEKITVYFDSNGADIKELSVNEINLLCALLKSKKKIYRITVSAVSDSSDKKRENKDLCIMRVRSVKMKLTDDGLDSNFIDEVFKKDNSLSNPGNKTDKTKANNRIDIEVVGFKKDKEMHLDVSDLRTNTETGTQIIVQNLDFEAGKHELLPEFLPVLDTLVEILKENKSMKIEIIGHVCCTAFEEDGLDIETKTKNLSYTRARSIYKYLIKHHIRSNRLTYSGEGGKNKLALPEITEQDKTLNRRVEIVVVKE